MLDGLFCFHEQVAVEVTDNIAEILFKEKNIHFKVLLKLFFSQRKGVLRVFSIDFIV